MQFCRDQHGQKDSDPANVASYRQKFLSNNRMLVRQSFETRADSVEVLNFIQDWLVTHICAPFLSG